MRIVLILSLILLPLGGFAVAITYRNSLVARLIGIGLAFVSGAYGVFMLVAAHRLAAELDFPGKAPSADWSRGVDSMRSIIVTLPVPLLMTALVALALMALTPRRD
jgi:hypothetical protein